MDTSNFEGTGFLLSQEDKEGKTRVVRCGSVAAKKSWKSLSPIEAEAVGICWSARSLDYYLRGAPEVCCIIDHCPLKTLMTAPLESLSPRMLRALLKLLPYHIEFICVPGRRHQICDALGRHPVYQSWKNLPEPMSNLTEDPPIHHVISKCDGTGQLPWYRSHGQGQSSHQVRPKLPGYPRECGRGIKKGNRQPPQCSSCPRAPINLGIMLQGHSRRGRRICASHPGGQHPPLRPHLRESISPVPPPPVTHRDKQDY